jgi:hypothetical protein
MEINIEEGTAVFHINETGNVTRQTYMGTFKVHCILSPLDFVEADKMYREMLGATNPADAHEHARSIAFALSQLKYRIIEEAPFWENRRLGGSHIKDDNIIITILNNAIEAEEKFREAKVKEAEEIQQRLQKAIEDKDIEKMPELDKDKKSDDDEIVDEISEEDLQKDAEDGSEL